MAEDTERFDIENIKHDTDGIPEIPRISFSVPKAYRKEYLQMMIDEVRLTPGEQLMAIFVKFMRHYRAEVLAVESASELPATERRRIPFYGPKQSTSKAAQDVVRSEGG